MSDNQARVEPDERSAVRDLARVREILSGAAHRALDARLASLLELLERSLAAMRESTEADLTAFREQLTTRIAELEQGKVDRLDLAELLSGVITHLGSAATPDEAERT